MKISKTKKNWKSLDRIQKRNRSARVPGRDEKLLEQVKELALKENIRLAAVQALGATNRFTVGVIITPRENAGFAERPHRGHNTSRA